MSDCYQSAFREITGRGTGLAAALADAIECEPRLVHGIAVLAAGPHEGDRFCHAWVEVGPLVIDHGKILLLELYYRVGRIDASDSVNYSADEARIQALRTEHYGPWTEIPAGVRFKELPKRSPRKRRGAGKPRSS